MNYDDAEALGRPWGAQVAKGVVDGLPAEGKDDARQTLRTQCFGGHAPLKPFVFMYIFNMHKLTENWSKTEARHTLRTVWFRGHGRLF